MQMIATALEKVSDWEALADYLDINIDTIRTNCADSSDRAQCYRRKLVKTHCDRLPSGDPYLAVERIAYVLEIKMEKKTQAQALRDLDFSSLFYNSVYMYSYKNNPRGYPDDSSSTCIFHYATFLRDMYANTPVARSDKLLYSPSKVYVKLVLVKKERVSHSMVDEFTRLTLQGDVDQILHVKERIEMDDIFKNDKTRLVLVEGAPGIGKSTLAWELCRQWPTLESLQHFSLVVLIRLRENRAQSATDLSDLLYHRDMALRRHVREEVEKRDGDGVLFIFDGFDEFPFELREKSLVMDIISGSEYLPKATVLVTSRPSASAQLQSHLQSSIGKHIEVVGFTEKEILEYASGVFTNADLLSNFKTFLSVNPVVKGMMYNPMNCAIVVGVYIETSELGKPVPHTQTQLYTELTLCLLSRHLSAVGDPQARKLPDKLEDLPSDLYQQLVKIGKLAFEGRLQEKVIFDQLPEGCSDLGLMVEHRALYTRKEITTFNFIHLTLQEYMSAFYISQLPASKQKALFIAHFQKLAVVWRFVAGLTKMQHIGWDVVRKKFKKENILAQHVYEAQDVRSCNSAFGQYKVTLEPMDLLWLSNYDFYALGYCICACGNTWSLAMIISESSLEMLAYGMKSVEYGGGSIDNFTLYIYDIFPLILEHFLHMPLQIIQNIKFLSLRNLGFNNVGFINLARLIPFLSSPISLDVSHNLGYAGSLLLQASKLTSLYLELATMVDVAALSHIVHPQSSLREPWHWVGLYRTLFPEAVHQLVQTLLLPFTLEILYLVICDASELDYIRSLSDSITSLLFYSAPWLCRSNERITINTVKGGTTLSHILRKNTSLRCLVLAIPLDEDEVYDLVHSLKDNHSLKELVLFEEYHAQYFSESERQALDPRIYFQQTEYAYVHDGLICNL